MSYKYDGIKEENMIEIGAISGVKLESGRRLFIDVIVSDISIIDKIINNIRIGNRMFSTSIDSMPKEFIVDSIEMHKDEYGLKVLKIKAIGLFVIGFVLDIYYDLIDSGICVNKKDWFLEPVKESDKSYAIDKETSSNVNK